MKVKLKRAMAYGRKHYAAGAELDMADRDAKLLTATGRAVLVDEVRERALQAEAAAELDTAKKGKYKRRDMQAEAPGEET